MQRAKVTPTNALCNVLFVCLSPKSENIFQGQDGGIKANPPIFTLQSAVKRYVDAFCRR